MLFVSSVCYAFVRVCLFVSFVVYNCEFVTFPLVSKSGVVLDCIDS